jgi:integrase
VQANRVQSLVSKIFSFALEADLVKANPAAQLRKRGKEKARTRTLADGEIRAFWNAVTAPPVSRAVGLALRLVLVLGCRPGEVAGISRNELEFDKRGAPVSWLIPAERTKNGRAHFVPLSPLARDLTAEALQLSKSSEHVFPSPTNGGAVASHAMSVAMQRLGKDQPDAPSAHDLRRTCATRLSAAGVRGEDIAAILNHVRADVTGKHYDQYQRSEEKRAALARWSRILTTIIERESSANVIELRG